MADDKEFPAGAGSEVVETKEEKAPDTAALGGAAAAEAGKDGGDDGEDAGAADEEECAADFKPVVQLEEQETVTGEEDETVEWKMRAKLFRFNTESQEWKERGTGDVRFLKHKETGKIRLLMRREKTLKICLNHYVNTTAELQENFGSDRSWMWNAIDYAEGERDECVLAIRFANSENAAEFKKQFEFYQAEMKKLLEAKD
ncbi:Ran-specific GTPase-activating protein [Porphyridium purpureum]|uniref:Ran-specific GTPase-activating protein n=1 Tax=Porphyridium purpureum TaxID=35688 RepID=A0A5J4YZE7_PORPP|nr:Ran-specific GTPase-activating protein [Porphyridium purpureum]|eukprot:POR9268..scf209_3